MISILSILYLAKSVFLPSIIELHGFPTYKVGSFVSSSTMDEYAAKRLATCESQWVNVVRPDSDGIDSDGLWQYHKGTWDEFSKESGILGTSTNPYQAALMTSWAIERGYARRWTCGRILHLK